MYQLELEIYCLSHVDAPKGKYNGQKLMKVVNTNTPASTNSTNPKVPVAIPVR